MTVTLHLPADANREEQERALRIARVFSRDYAERAPRNFVIWGFDGYAYRAHWTKARRVVVAMRRETERPHTVWT